MTQLISDRRDIEFVLHEQLEAETLAGLHENFADFNRKTIDLVVSEGRNLALKVFLEANKDGDVEGCTLENGKVTTPESFKQAYKLYNEGEWLALPDDPEVGGQGVPETVASAVREYFVSSNFAFMMYPGLTHGAARLVKEFGTPEQKKLYMKNMFSGKWAGTMLLTEAGAGSDVGALTTKAVKNEDGTYSITGEKNIHFRRRP